MGDRPWGCSAPHLGGRFGDSIEASGLNQPYFIVVLAHSLHGRLRRIHVPYQAIYAVLVLAVIGVFSVLGFVSSYVRMAWKVADYNRLRTEVSAMRSRYQKLEKESKQTGQQLASLQLLANEVSVAYGLKRELEGPSDISAEGRLVPTIHESLEQYNFLRSASLSLHSRRSNILFQPNMLPSIWPIEGRLDELLRPPRGSAVGRRRHSHRHRHLGASPALRCT